MKVAVIGGGASGILAGIYAKKKGHDVTIIEKNKTCGKKLLMTGNGRCNYFNVDQEITHYHSKNKEVLTEIITKENLKEIEAFFHSIGLVPKIKNGYYYPVTNQASSVLSLLEQELDASLIQRITDFPVVNIEKRKQHFYVSSTSHCLVFDAVILATGSKAYPVTGSTGDGYAFARNFSHHIRLPLPSLVPLEIEEPLRKWAGIRCDVSLSLFENGKFLKEETGEIQLTDYGISGICTFNLSGIIARGLEEKKKMEVVINFLPWLVERQEVFFASREEMLKNRTAREFLTGLLPEKLIPIILNKVGIGKNERYSDMSKKKKDLLFQQMVSYRVVIVGTKSFDRSQVCSGGVLLSEINPLTMESKLVKNLYFTGEILDVDGDCGGYNLTFAFLSGMLAGKGVGK